MSYSFGQINIASKKSILKVKLEKNFILEEYLESPTQPIVNILVDQYFKRDQISAINLFLKGNGLRNYRIMATVNSKDISPHHVKEVLKEPIIKFYTNNQSDYRKLIEKGSIVIATGASIYSLTECGNIYTNDMYDILFSPPKIAVNGNWTYVVDSFSDIFAKGYRTGPIDSYKTKIFQYRIKDLIYNGKVKPPTQIRIKKIQVADEEFESWAEEILKKDYTHVAADTETSGFDFMNDRIGDITLSFGENTGYHIFLTPDKIPTLNKILLNHIIIGTNFKFDAKFLWEAGFSKDIDWGEDVFILGHTLNETRRNSLKTLSYLYTPNGGYDKPLDDFKEKVKVDSYIDDIPDELRIPYAIMDAVQTYNIWEKATEHMRALDKRFPNERYPQHTLESYYRNFRIPVDNTYAGIEFRGVYVSPDQNQIGREGVEADLLDMRKQMYSELGLPAPVGVDGKFNDSIKHPFDSPAQLGILLEGLGWENLGVAKGKNKTFLTGDFQLERWSKTHKAAKLLQRYRSAKTILQTFIGNQEETKGWTKYYRHHKDGSVRMHPNFTTMGADTGRSKCKHPNMQNPPAHGEFAANATRMFVTPDDDKYFMVTADYSALQLRLATIDSGDPVLTKVFKSDEADMHSLTGYNVIKNREFDLDIIKVEQDGKNYKFLGGQMVNVKRGDRDLDVFACDLVETDVLI